MAPSLKKRGTVGKRRTKADTCPLFQRSDGRWSKKIRGRHVYFGRDKAEALAKYHREAGLLAEGITPDRNDIGLRELFNRYLEAQRRKMMAGKIGARTVSDSAATLKRVIAVLNDRLVSTLTAEDFARLAMKLARGRSPISVSGDVRRTKAAFRWAWKEGLIPKLPNYGSEFEPAPIRVVRLAKAKRGLMMFEAAELRSLIAAAPVTLKAIILLGANAALLPVDVARLTFEEFDKDLRWLWQARHKTGVDRLAYLWDETRDALKAAIAAREKPANPEYRDLVFLTETGLPLVRTVTPAKAEHDPKFALNATIINRVSSDFRELQQALGMYRKGRGFNSLRHGFLTVAESGRDFIAVAKIMGHSIPGVSSHYSEYVDNDRIRAACEVVRTWLFADGGQRPKPR